MPIEVFYNPGAFHKISVDDVAFVNPIIEKIPEPNNVKFQFFAEFQGHVLTLQGFRNNAVDHLIDPI